MSTSVHALRREISRLTTAVVQYRRWFERAPMGFHIIDPAGKIINVNQRWLDLLGYSRSEVTGRSIFEFIVPEQRENARARFEARLKGAPLPEKIGDRQYVKKDGTVISVDTVDTVFKNRRGRVVAVQTSFQDITALREAQARLIEKERQAAAAELAGVVAHTLKNQITSAAGFLHRALRATEDNRPLLQAIQHEMEGMDRLVRGALAFSRTPSAETTLIGVREQLELMMPALEEMALQQSVKITLQSTHLQPTDGILISETVFQDIIRNLVMNAIESYDRHPGENRQVTVTAVRTGEDLIQITVSDNGCGIEPARLATLLRNPVKSFKPRGTGLGLSIVRKEVDAAEGRVWIKSAVGSGTEVAISFPRKDYSPPQQTPPAEPQPLSPEEAARITILVVDDNPAILLLNETLLGYLGFKVISRSSAREALGLFSGEGDRPGVVLTDQNMPEMEGHKLIEEIARRGGSLPYFIIYSGNPAPDEAEHPVNQTIRRFGCSYLEKGARPAKFGEQVSRIIAQKIKR